jgi:type IV pilus assembly protein PilA
MTDATPAGWYQDPAGSGGQRYWDGAAWTEHHQPPAYLGPPPSPTGSPVPVWLIVALAVGALVVVAAVFAAIAVPTFLGARERADDRAAQSNVRTAAVVAKTIGVDARPIMPEVMHTVEPSLDFTTDASTGPSQVSVFDDGVAVTVTARSSTGTCWLIRLDLSLGAGAPMLTGKLPPGQPCHAGTDPSRIIVGSF